MRPGPLDERRQAALTKAVDAGVLHFAAWIDGRFHVQATPTATTKQFTGSQVNALLYGIRIGQINADKPLQVMMP
jgi:hypothetical protein